MLESFLSFFLTSALLMQRDLFVDSNSHSHAENKNSIKINATFITQPLFCCWCRSCRCLLNTGLFGQNLNLRIAEKLRWFFCIYVRWSFLFKPLSKKHAKAFRRSRVSKNPVLNTYYFCFFICLSAYHFVYSRRTKKLVSNCLSCYSCFLSLYQSMYRSKYEGAQAVCDDKVWHLRIIQFLSYHCFHIFPLKNCSFSVSMYV